MAETARDDVLQCRWCGPAGISASLTHYPSAGVQDSHWHDHHQLSIALAGSLRERLEAREFEVSGTALGNKPPGARHADTWGPEGVLIFTLRLAPAPTQQLELPAEPRWLPIDTSAGAIAPCLREVFLCDGHVSEQVVVDLVAALQPAPAPLAVRPPWLEQIRRQIVECPDEILLSEAAREAGVTRVHLSRTFRAAYGVTPSVYRRHVLLARALRQLIRGNGRIADVAAAAGFYDQAHFTRAMRRATGLSPARARALLRNVTSVQDAGSTRLIPVAPKGSQCSRESLRQS